MTTVCSPRKKRPYRIWIIWWLISCLFQFDCFTGKNQFFPRFNLNRILFFQSPTEYMDTKLPPLQSLFTWQQSHITRIFSTLLYTPFMVDFFRFSLKRLKLIVFQTNILLHFRSYFFQRTYECTKYKLFKKRKNLVFQSRQLCTSHWIHWLWPPSTYQTLLFSHARKKEGRKRAPLFFPTLFVCFFQV